LLKLMCFTIVKENETSLRHLQLQHTLLLFVKCCRKSHKHWDCILYRKVAAS